MKFIDRRQFLRASSGAALTAALPGGGFIGSATAQSRPDSVWDAGSLRHLLPTVSDSRILVKAWFKMALAAAPRLRIGDLLASRRMTDTRGEHWQFQAANLRPGQRYALSLQGSDGKALCQPWGFPPFRRPMHARSIFGSSSFPAPTVTRR